MRNEESQSVTEESAPIETISFVMLQAEAAERESSQEEIGHAQKMQKAVLRKAPFGLRQGKMVLKEKIRQQQGSEDQGTGISVKFRDRSQSLRFFWPGEGANLIPP